MARRAAWMCVAGAAVLAAFAPVVTGSRTLLSGDVARLYAPTRGLVVEALRAGRLPLWNPHVATGKALFAEGVHGVLHPVSLLGALVAPRSLDFLLLAYLVCAAAGAAVLIWALGGSPAAGAAAGTAYALAGYTVSMTGNLVFLAGAATLPWTVAAVRSCGGERPLAMAAAAAGVAACLFSGDVQVALLGTALGLVLAVERGGGRGAARALGGIAIGVLVAGVHLAASWGELAVTYRGVGLSPEDARSWALSPWRLVELLAPGFFRADLGRDFAPVFFALDPASASAERLVPFADSICVGASVLALAALSGRGRVTAILGAAAAAALWLALGHHAGARQLLGNVPLWSSFRYAEKLVGPATLALTTLAGIGFDRVAQVGLSRRATRGLAGAAVVTAAAATLCLGAPAAAAAPLGMAGLGAPVAAEATRNLSTGLLHATAALALLLAAALAPPRLRRPLLFAAVAAPALAAVPFARRLEDPAILRVGPPPLVADAPGARVGRVEPRFLVDPEGAAAGHRRLLEIARRSAMPAANVAFGVDAVDDYSGFDARRHANLVRSAGDAFPLLARRFAATHVAVVGRDATPEMRARAAQSVAGGHRVFEDRALEVEYWEVPHRPWASFAPRVVAAGGPAAARDALLALEAAGDHATVVVEAPAPPPCADGHVRSLERDPERIRIEAEADGQALLIVNDAFWPGWRATVDGREVPILAADVLVRAVGFPAGRHVLEMRYDPPEVRLGWTVTAVGLVLLCGAAAYGLVRRPARSRGGARA